MTPSVSYECTCTLEHHGAAASSVAQAVTWIPCSYSTRLRESAAAQSEGCSPAPSSTLSRLVYASHAIVNVCSLHPQVRLSNGIAEPVWKVHTTLRTALAEGNASLVLTALAAVAMPQEKDPSLDSSHSLPIAIVTAFSDGSLSLWIEQDISSSIQSPAQATTTSATTSATSSSTLWKEFILVDAAIASESLRSITTVDALWLPNFQLAVILGSSAGATYTVYDMAPTQTETHTETLKEMKVNMLTQQVLWQSAVKTVALSHHAVRGLLVLLGTAAPRHNRIHVYHCENHNLSLVQSDSSTSFLHYVGGLSGHEDWITCLAWKHDNNNNNNNNGAFSGSSLLATGSQDARIRLWRFSTTKLSEEEQLHTNSGDCEDPLPLLHNSNDDEDGNDEDNAVDKQTAEEEEEGEARLEIVHSSTPSGQKLVTRVTLEALLLGHEEMVTHVAWHPAPRNVYGDDWVLLSSSMDRSIFLWTASQDDGIWTPLTRVGSAGGILGGSIGSTLLGYLSASLDPSTGRCLVGHAYGGSLHMWRLDDTKLLARTTTSQQDSKADELTVEERAALVQWKSKPCVTGHFGGVVDLSWEASRGDYLLTASHDQTCRLWAPVSSVWLELGRPQVHGYDLSAVASISTRQHRHLLVTGADEKELRAFDAPKATIRLLEQTIGLKANIQEDTVQRVDRAYIPSLGLSNKATAAESAEEEAPENSSNIVAENSTATTTQETLLRLPVERDLGAVSLWPEIRKLFGHNTELYCLTSTLAAQSNQSYRPAAPIPWSSQILVASSCKARDVESAAIRLWNVHEGTCYQVLVGGHKATVATLAFSPCGSYLASSGKDRRLCLWKRQVESSGKFELAWAQDSAHKRIIWSVHFCPWNPQILVSGSRDGCVKVWYISEAIGGVGGDGQDNACKKVLVNASAIHSFAPAFTIHGKPDAVTSLSFCPIPLGDESMGLLAVGLDSGRIELWRVPTVYSTSLSHPVGECKLVSPIPASYCHRATITKLAWKPQGQSGETSHLLGSSSMDHGVRIFKIDKSA